MLLLEPQPVIQCLANNNFVVEPTALPKFQRILIICENTRVSSKIVPILSDHFQFKITYSIKDVVCRNCRTEYATMTRGLFEPLESGSRRFLILPLSPPAEWDHWDKVEEGPNQQAVYAPLMNPRISYGNAWEMQDSSQVRKFHGEPHQSTRSRTHVTFENIDNGVPAIILDLQRRARNHRLRDERSQRRQCLLLIHSSGYLSTAYRPHGWFFFLMSISSHHTTVVMARTRSQKVFFAFSKGCELTKGTEG